MHRANMMRDMACDSLSDVIRIGVEAELEPLARMGEQSELDFLPGQGLGA
jgi:hypothetical protein